MIKGIRGCEYFTILSIPMKNATTRKEKNLILEIWRFRKELAPPPPPGTKGRCPSARNKFKPRKYTASIIYLKPIGKNNLKLPGASHPDPPLPSKQQGTNLSN